MKRFFWIVRFWLKADMLLSGKLLYAVSMSDDTRALKARILELEAEVQRLRSLLRHGNVSSEAQRPAYERLSANEFLAELKRERSLRTHLKPRKPKLPWTRERKPRI